MLTKTNNRPIIGIGRLSSDVDCQMADTDYRQTGRLSADTDHQLIIGAPLVESDQFSMPVLAWSSEPLKICHKLTTESFTMDSSLCGKLFMWIHSEVL